MAAKKAAATGRTVYPKAHYRRRRALGRLAVLVCPFFGALPEALGAAWVGAAAWVAAAFVGGGAACAAGGLGAVFSWITWPWREVRDKGMRVLTTDPRMQPEANPMQFDGKRKIFGGFMPIVEKR